MVPSIRPVILAGGAGTRLWPLSRELYPKQFLELLGDQTMLQATLARLSGLPIEPPIVVCNEEHRFLVAEQCRAQGQSAAAIILEPEPKDTAPAIALAAFRSLVADSDPVMLVLPADHHIARPDLLRDAVLAGMDAVEDGALLTFGVVPTGPEIGYGYIKIGAERQQGVHDVDEFVEKPDWSAARSFVESGAYAWNSGMFMFKASAYLGALDRHRPGIHECCRRAAANAGEDMDFWRPGREFLDSDSESIDYAVMEHADNAVVIRVDIGWSDVGSWRALWAAADHDDNGNALLGDVISIDSTDCYVRADDRLVATIGMEDTIVVETGDVVLVADKQKVDAVKDVVLRIRNGTRTEHHSHVQVYRPWGSYRSMGAGDGYQVKRITVKPGESLSLQLHEHRSEHWVVVRGTALVRRGDEEFELTENESTYIPVGTKHRLSNMGTDALELIEVQVGAYLGEDDIVRFTDVYGRCQLIE